VDSANPPELKPSGWDVGRFQGLAVTAVGRQHVLMLFLGEWQKQKHPQNPLKIKTNPFFSGTGRLLFRLSLTLKQSLINIAEDLDI